MIIPKTLTLAALAAMSLTTGANAANFLVNSFADANDLNPGNGVCASAARTCTLRAAIEEANALASPPFNPDVINVPGGVYALSLGPLTITDDLRIIGDNAGAYVDGQHLDSVFVIAGGETLIGVELHYLRIRNGRAADQFGGGISNDSGNLLVHRCRIQSSDSFTSGGGIYNPNGSILSLVESSLSNNGRTGSSSMEPQRGGGLYNSGIAYVNRSTVNLNVAGRGGGIYQSSSGYMIMRNSTVIGNTGYIDIGGIVAGGTSFLNNVTVANNHAVPELDPTSPVQPSATGGIYGTQNTFMANSIVALNQLGPDGEFTERQDCAGTINSLGYNLVYDPAGCNLAGNLTGNITGQDPVFGPLNSSGYTPVYSLAPRSPAINAGNPAFPTGLGNACEPTDQRFMQRGIGPAVGRCDIGAYERGGAPAQEAAP